MNDPGFVELREAFRRLAARQVAAGGVFIALAPSTIPFTAREVLALLFGESHASHSVTAVDKRAGVRIVYCSCGIRWFVDEAFCNKKGTKYPMVEAALRNAPPPQKA